MDNNTSNSIRQPDIQTESREALWQKASAVVLVCFLIVYLILAMLLPSDPFGESGSTLLPAVCLSNHGSFRITQEDLEEACVLFPGHAEQLRSYYPYMPEALEGEGHYPYYLGVYAPLCVPALNVLRLLKLNPVYAFAITNALLLSIALWVVYRFARISAKKKLLAILLLGTSPIVRYINLQLYEVALFSFVVMAMVFWFNRSRKRAALFLSIGGTINPAIMAFGFLIILDYFLEMLVDSKLSLKAFFGRFVADWKKTACLAACFLPCFIPFVLTRIGLGYWYIITNMGAGTTQGLGGRFLAYLFDLNLGLFPYFPVLMFLFAAITIWGGVHGKRYDMLCTFFGALAVIGAYSLQHHINCGMIGIARYNVMLCPIIILGTIYYTDVAFSGVTVRRLCSGLTVLSCLWCVFVIGVTAYSHGGGDGGVLSPMAETVLKYAPGLYDPLPSTFQSRAIHKDGYNITGPVIYSDDELFVRKVLVPPGMLDQAIQELSVPAEDQAVFEKQCAKVKRTDKYYYLDFPAGTHIRQYIPYELGQTVGFGTDSPKAIEYVLEGISGPELGYAWTDADEMKLTFGLQTAPQSDLQMLLNISGVFLPPQRMMVSAGDTVLLDEVIKENMTQTISFTIPKESFEGSATVLTFELPDAISPREAGISGDMREIALALSSFCIVPDGSGQIK